MLRKKLDLADETGHVMNAAWFRLAGGIDIENWSDNEEWLARMPERGIRARSTIHLVDQGYWVWLIHLGTGPISVGVVADPRFHPFEEINEYDRMVEWFKKHEPQLAAEVEGRRHDVQDFLVIENFSYKSTQIVSTDRWALVGESAAFIDALYSPGSDFIAYANTFAHDLITRDLGGEDIEERLEFFNFMFFELFEPYVRLYKDQYQFFGNTQVMLGKQLFDNNIYFSTLAFVFLHDKLTDLDDLPEILEQLQPFIDLGARMQEFFRDWHALGEQQRRGGSVLNYDFKPMGERIEELVKPFEHEAMLERLAQSAQIPERDRRVAVPQGRKAASGSAGRGRGDQSARDQPQARSVGGRRPLRRRRHDVGPGAGTASRNRGVRPGEPGAARHCLTRAFAAGGPLRARLSSAGSAKRRQVRVLKVGRLAA